jgi:hypothetical protein
MDEIDSKIADMENELQRLSTVIEALGERLARGENAVRAELNPAIRRERALSLELYELKIATGRAKAEPAILYGPPRDLPDAHRSAPGAQGSVPGTHPSTDDLPRTDEAARGGFLRRLFRRK